MSQPEEAKPDPPQLSAVPEYALKHAPLLKLSSKERFWPIHVAKHIKNCELEKSDGTPIQCPAEHDGKVSLLSCQDVNSVWVFLKTRVSSVFLSIQIASLC
jgi:hypothetical protein